MWAATDIRNPNWGTRTRVTLVIGVLLRLRRPRELGLDTAKKRELGDRPSCKEKGAPARATCFAYAQLS